MIKVFARGEMTRKCSPGDIVTITGVYMPAQSFGFKSAGLIADTFIEAF
jgi:DNA replication licensing factor MCM7